MYLMQIAMLRVRATWRSWLEDVVLAMQGAQGSPEGQHSASSFAASSWQRWKERFSLPFSRKMQGSKEDHGQAQDLVPEHSGAPQHQSVKLPQVVHPITSDSPQHTDQACAVASSNGGDAWPARRTRTLTADVAAATTLTDREQFLHPESSYDTVVDTFGLCSCADPVAALQQMAKVCVSTKVVVAFGSN